MDALPKLKVDVRVEEIPVVTEPPSHKDSPWRERIQYVPTLLVTTSNLTLLQQLHLAMAYYCHGYGSVFLTLS